MYIDIEDLTLNSLHTTLVFQAEDKVVTCPPLSLGMTEVCSVAVPTLCCCFSSPSHWKFCSKCFFLWGHDEKISLLLLRLRFVFTMKYFSDMHRLHLFVAAEYGCTLSNISHDKRRTSNNFVLRLKHQCRMKRFLGKIYIYEKLPQLSTLIN